MASGTQQEDQPLATQREHLLRAVFDTVLALLLLVYATTSWLTDPSLRYDVVGSFGFGVFFAVFAVLRLRRYRKLRIINAFNSAFNPDAQKRRAG